MVEQAIQEAKAQSQARDKAQIASANTGRISVGKHFKYVSKEARRQGVARLMYEDMVRRAERKLSELERKSHAEIQDAEARAEELAKELFHTPGTLLTEDEMARMKTESGCTARPMPKCYTPTFERFRTIDGLCNNIDFPFTGAAETELARLIPSQYEDGISQLRGHIQATGSNILKDPFSPPNPSARLISETIIRNVSEDEELSHMLMQWGQFVDHDITLVPVLENKPECRDLGCTFTDICEPIQVPDRDPVFGVETSNNANCLPFSRSLASCEDGEKPAEPSSLPGIQPREQLNDLTSFLDASTVYGSDDELALKIRGPSGGLLLEGEDFPGTMPALPKVTQADNKRTIGEGTFVDCPSELPECFLAGEFRVNEQIALTVMHTIWFREHNRIARELGSLNPQWKDERIYQETRKIIGALVQKITFSDFLPRVLGKKVFDIVVGPFLGDFDPTVDPSINNAFATAAFRFGHTLIRPFFDRLGSDFMSIAQGPLNLLNAFFEPDQFRESFGTDPILRGLLTQNSRRVDEFLAKVLTSDLFREGMDLASLNIQRGRDHGLPSYLTWQRFCQSRFPTLSPNAEPTFANGLTQVRFVSTYGSLDTVDLWIGGLAEERLEGSLLGPTFACLFGITFSNLRAGDRFFYQNPGQFDAEQLKSIESDSLSRVICDNSDNIDSIQPDAFLAGTATSRVPCTQLPRVDLSLWQEGNCYISVEVSGTGPDKLQVNSFSRVNKPSFVFFYEVFRLGGRGCLPFICPTRLTGSDVVVFVPRPNNVDITANSLLPADSVASDDIYRGILTAAVVDNPLSGLFRDLASCQLSSSTGIKIFSSGAVANLEANLMQQNNRITAESPSTTENLPPEIRDILLEPYAPATTAAAKLESNEDEAEAEAQLMSDLEEALNALEA